MNQIVFHGFRGARRRRYTRGYNLPPHPGRLEELLYGKAK